MADTIVLDFHNSLLRKSDVKLLEKPFWLNDNLINFAYEYFEYNLFEKHSDKVAFIGPATVQFLKLGSEGDMVGVLESLGLVGKEIIFFAINNSATSKDAGSHWSTLVYHQDTGSFEHYDSFHNNNHDAALSVATSLQAHLAPGNKTASALNYKDMLCPQQTNGCDCGMYVICLTEHIADYSLNRKKPAFETITPSVVNNARDEWRKKIHLLGKGEK